MASLYDEARKISLSLTAMSGGQTYFLDVPGTDSAAQLSVVSFDATEKMGDPNVVRIMLTHPQQLARTDYLSRHAIFRIVQDDGAPKTFSGYIERFSIVQTTKDFRKYEIVLKSHFGRLQAATNTQVFQHLTTPQIIQNILSAHGIKDHQMSFRLRGQYPKHLWRFQYQMTDFDYVHMLMEKAGIYCYVVETEYGDQIVFGDDIDHYLYDPQLIVPYREAAGLEANGVEAVTALKTHTETVPQSFVVADYNPEQAWERFRDEANVAPQDPTTYGHPYIYGTHHLDQQGAKWEAQLRHEAAIARQVIYEGESNVLALQCARVLETDAVLPDAPKGQVVVEITHRGARDKPYTNSYKAIPADRRFRLQMGPVKWTKIAGTLSARVCSPDKYTYSYLNAAGYYVVRLDADFGTWPKGGESVPLRLAKPFAGKLQTGMHFVALDNDEATISFRDGDPDKPEISGFHHHSQARDLVTNDRRWLSRNMIRTQSNNKLRMEDWAGQEGIKLSTEHSGKSQLNLGYLVNQKLEYRGEGYELRTSGYGALRAGKGMYISAHDRPSATGQQLDMQEAKTHLAEAFRLMQGLEQTAQAVQAYTNQIDEQRRWLSDHVDRLQKAVILASAPAGIALTSGDQFQISAASNLIATALHNVDVGSGRNLTLSAGNGASLLAVSQDVKITAAKADVHTVAHAGQIVATSAKDMKLTSVGGTVHVAAREALILSCGGTYIKLTSSGVEIGSPGAATFKCVSIGRQGPASLADSFPPLANVGPNARKFVLHYDGDEADVLKNYRYRLHKENGAVIEGVTNANGETCVAQSEIAEIVRVEILGAAS
jgi:type VI secretion system secreted protein VgrG